MKKQVKLTREEWFAQERTMLSNERTMLSYIRTSLTAVVFGLALMQFGRDNPTLVNVGGAAIFIGILIAIIGMVHFFSIRRRLRNPIK